MSPVSFLCKSLVTVNAVESLDIQQPGAFELLRNTHDIQATLTHEPKTDSNLNRVDVW